MARRPLSTGDDCGSLLQVVSEGMARPPAKRSWTKSMAHPSLRLWDGSRGALEVRVSLLRRRTRTCSRSSRSTRETRLRFTSQPSRRSSRQSCR